MRRSGTILLVTGMVAVSLASEPPDDRALIEQAPAQSAVSQSADEPAARGDAGRLHDSLSAAERAARIEANLALARLELIHGRQALGQEDFKEAARKAHQVMVLLRQLPPEVDADELELQAEGILARAQRAGVDVAALARDAGEEAPLHVDDAAIDRQVQGAVGVARQYEGVARRDVDTSGDARALRERTLRRQTPDRYGYRPGREIIDVDAILARDRQRLVYQDALREAYKADEVRMLVAADEARLVPDGVVSYPNDWPAKMRRRQQWAHGVMARSAPWHDRDGREWYVAIYDIQDLTFVPPNFGMNFFDGGYAARRAMRDRQALRDHSMIFRGGAAELAAGIPLLRYFGGIDTWLVESPFSAERQREIVRLIEAYTGVRVDDGLTLPPAPE